MLPLIVFFGLKSLLSTALVALTVNRSLELVENIEQALENPQRRGAVTVVCRTAFTVCVGLVVCAAVTWRLVRHVPFSP